MLQLAEEKKQKILDKSVEAVTHWLERFDSIIIGPGLGKDEMVHAVVKRVIMLFLVNTSQTWCKLSVS